MASSRDAAAFARMKLIIQIPAFNEEKTIARTIAELPRKLDGVTSVEVLVIDDGSVDATVDAAKRAGAEHVLRLTNHRGLAAAFTAGINAALKLGAEIIVNTDADNQYRADDIARLIAPILDGSADVVIGDRGVLNSAHMGPFKRMLQIIGSRAVGMASGIRVPDATSGMRAFSREAAYQINVFNPFTYTLETIIQAGNRNLEVKSVLVGTNAPTRPSRLYRGIGSYVSKSVVTLFRVYTLYKPLKTFFGIGATLLLAGVALGLRFLYYFTTDGRAGHLQSLILAAILSIVGVVTILIGLLADLISVNRRLSEEILIRLKKLEQPSLAKIVKKQKGPQTAQPAKPPSPSPPGPQWVWLIDEETLDRRSEERASQTLEAPKQESPKPGQGSRRRRRRRGGMKPYAEQKVERMHHPHVHPEPEEGGDK